MPIRLTQVSPLGQNFTSVQKIAAQAEALTYRDFYESAQRHVNSVEPHEPVLTG
jgi:hypothetical protein